MSEISVAFTTAVLSVFRGAVDESSEAQDTEFTSFVEFGGSCSSAATNPAGERFKVERQKSSKNVSGVRTDKMEWFNKIGAVGREERKESRYQCKTGATERLY